MEYDHPLMERVRDYVAGLVASNNVHPRLIANFDQIWSMKFRPTKKAWSKDGEAMASRAPADSADVRRALSGASLDSVEKRKKDPLEACVLNVSLRQTHIKYLLF